MAEERKLRPGRLVVLAGLLGLVFLLLLVLAAVRLGPTIVELVRGALDSVAL